MGRVAFTMKLKPGCEAEYIARHQAIWPELAALLKAAGVSNYSIFLDCPSRTLFAVQDVSDGTGSQDLGSHPVVRKWWAFMSELMETNADLSPVSIPVDEVFHLD